VIHQSDAEALLDRAYQPGDLALLAAGNLGRMLDGRRTPIRVIETDVPTGTWMLEVLAFEDAGARWVLELEAVDRFQFEADVPRLDRGSVAELRAAVDRLDRPLRIPIDRTARLRTLRRLADEERRAASALPGDLVTLDLTGRAGDPVVQARLETYMAGRDLGDLEAGFSEGYVSNPTSGEVVKGHRIVIARLGLVAYHGKVVRDPAIFDGRWSEDRRGEHVLARLGFVRALFRAAGRSTVPLWRAIASETSLRPHPARTFVSATFDRAVAESLFDAGPATRVAALYRQDVSIERLFMSYVETAAMNRRFHEAEALLLADPRNLAF
jgi:hypothetical protein